MSFYDGEADESWPKDLSAFEFIDHPAELDKARGDLLIARYRLSGIVTVDNFEALEEAELGYKVTMERAAGWAAGTAENLSSVFDFYIGYRNLRHGDLVKLLEYRPCNPFRGREHRVGAVEARLRDIAFDSNMQLKERLKPIHSTEYGWRSRDLNDLHRLEVVPVLALQVEDDLAQENRVFWSSLASRRGYMALKKAGFELPEVY